MENLSPKKYIQTRARSLPVYKCYANKDWERAGMANIIVTRRHVNKKITGGIYIVDLGCLGIKDTSWFFNITEEEFFDRIPDFETLFEEIGYNLAHNIIYAGYDFAMEFDIGPQKDFSITKFILEEDDENIPLIEVAVGDEDGLPHLMTYSPTEHLDALAKLKKNAGEGNFHYTYGIRGMTDDEEYEDDEDDDDDDDDDGLSEDELNDDADPIPLSEIEYGTIDPHSVKGVVHEELMDVELLKTRTENEQLICLAEAFLRIVAPENVLSEDEEILMEKEWEYYHKNDIHYTEHEVTAYKACIDIIKATVMGEEPEEPGKEVPADLEGMLRDVKDNPIAAASLNIVDLLIEGKSEKISSLIVEKLEELCGHDIIQMSLALRAVVTNTDKGSYGSILERHAYNNVFSGKIGNFHEDCLILYYMIQIIRYSESGKIALAIDYYYLLSGLHGNMLFTFGNALFYPVFINALAKSAGLEISPMVVNRTT